jgi:2-oxo-3-hexenedioate decarboxylase
METSQKPRGWSGSSTEVDCDAVAQAFVTAWRERTFVSAPTRTIPGFSRADALAIAERVRALRIAAGAVPIGYKVGFTNAAVRAQFDAAGPMAAPVYDETLAPAPRVTAGALLGPRIEPEVVVGLGADGEIAWAALGFEIVQSHVADWDFGYLDTIVDFGLHAALIVGERRPIGPDDAAWLTAMPVQLRCNGDVFERGAGSDVDGGALGSLAWLRADLLRAGRELQPGEIVSTGSMTRVPKIATGERWTLEAPGSPLPPLTIDVL